MRVAALLLAALAISPPGSALAEPFPDTSEAEDEAIAALCSVAPLSLCPADVASPPAREDLAEGAAVSEPDVVAEAESAARDVAADPATAPDRLGDLLAVALEVVRALLDAPRVGATALADRAFAFGAGVAHAATAARDGLGAGADATRSAVRSAFEAAFAFFAPQAGRSASPAESVEPAASIPGRTCAAVACVELPKISPRLTT